jgi:hypothetical protein
MAQLEQHTEPTSALPADPTEASTMPAAPQMVRRPVKGRRAAWVLGIVCALLLVVAGVGTAVFLTDLREWNQTIADQERQISDLEAKSKDLQRSVVNHNGTLSKAVADQVVAKAEDSRATSCRQAVSALLQSPLNDLTVVQQAVAKVFFACPINY